jgi:hypothetical protein
VIRAAVIPEQKESDFLGAVQDLADSLGWLWIHIDPALNDRGYWRTPIRGPLGAGWPDLFLLHPGKRRMIYAELKARYRKTTPQQDEVLGYLGDFGFVETYVWWPKDWEGIVECLAR